MIDGWWRSLAVVLTLSVACESGTATEPASIDTCDRIADATVDLLQDQLDIVAGLAVDDLLATESPDLRELETRSAALEVRAGQLECDRIELRATIREGIDELEADGPLAEQYLEMVIIEAHRP